MGKSRGRYSAAESPIVPLEE